MLEQADELTDDGNLIGFPLYDERLSIRLIAFLYESIGIL